MNRCLSRVTWRLSPGAAWAVGALLALCGPMPVFAAERTVLCEEFTNNW
jgi:hypothetical protein